MRSKPLLFALFVSGLITQSAFAQSQSILPHFANGLFADGSFRTTFVVVNNTDTTATAVLALTKDNGEPLEVTIPGLGIQSSFTLILPPGAARILQTDGSGNLISGAATVTSNVPVGVSAVFTLLDPEGNFLSEAGVGDSPALSQFTLPVQVSRTLDTGIALFNPSTSPVTLNLRLLDGDGTVVGATQLNLPLKNHVARFASELFPITDFLGGSIAVEATGKIAALALRQNNSAGKPTYTTLPITSGVTQGTAEETRIGATPRQVNGLTGVVAVGNSAVLKSDGTVWVLKETPGAERNTVVSITPTPVDGLTEVVAVSGHMALRSDGTVWDFSGSKPAQVSGLGNVAAIHQSAGGVMALKRDGTVWAWWWNPDMPLPIEVGKARGAVAVAEVAFGGLALMGDGTVWLFGLMGEESDSYLSYWGQLRGLDGIVAIDATYDAGLALKNDGTVWHFGERAGMLVQGITGVTGISAGGRSLALARDGTVWEWGRYYLRPGDGAPPTPRQVTGLTGIVQIAASYRYGLALLGDGTVWVWGYN